MDIGDSVSISIFCIAVVFGLLAVIYLLIKVSTQIIKHISSRTGKQGG